jgi:hypothetical protein
MKFLNLLLTSLVLLCATPARATWTTFDAVDDLLTVTQFAGINVPAFTAMCHTNRTSGGEANLGMIFEKANTGSWTQGWDLRTSATPIMVMGSYSEGTSGEWTTGSLTFPAHISIAYNGASASNDPNIYVNAALQSETETSTPGAAIVTGSNNLRIGNTAAQTTTWGGQLGDCAIFTGLLSANAILSAQHYGPQWVGGTICYWPMGSFGGRNYGGTGGSSCNATVSGSPATSESGPKRSSPQGGFIFLGP